MEWSKYQTRLNPWFIIYIQPSITNGVCDYKYHHTIVAALSKKAMGMTREELLAATKLSNGGAQIDMVIDRADQVITLCEMKYSLREFEIDKAYGERLEAKVRAFADETKTKKALHTTLVTTYGVKHNRYSGLIQSEVTMGDLFG